MLDVMKKTVNFHKKPTVKNLDKKR